MFHCIKWQHIFDSNIVPASKDGTMKHNLSWCSTGSTMPYETEKFINIWPRRQQQDFIMPPNIRLHRHPHCPNSCKIFCQTSSVLTCRNCKVCQCSWCCMQGISLLITPATIWSPIYPNLWMRLVRDSGLIIFLTQILIWASSVAVHSQLYLAWIHDKELHTHTHFCPISWLFSFPPVPYSLHDHSVQVLVLQMTCQTHFGSKMAASLSAATHSSSRFSCAMFWSASVTKDCKQSQSSFKLMWKEWSPYSTASLSSRIYIFHLYMAPWHTLQFPLLCCTACSQNFPLIGLPISKFSVHKMRRLTIQLCQYRYP